MSELDDSFAKLLGRQPTDRDRQELIRVKDALGLKNNDVMWLILMALQHYQSLYADIPASIKDAAQKAAGSAAGQAQAEISTAVANLTKTVSEVAVQVAHNTSAKQKWQWAAGCVAVTFTAFCVFGWYMHKAGYEAGRGAGYNEVKDEKAAEAWANTPEGKLAYRFAQTGSITSLAKCDKPGWKVENGVCFVNTTSDNKIHGWKLP